LLVPILRQLVVLVAGGVALFTGEVGLAWSLFGGLILLPRLLYRWAERSLRAGHVARANWLRKAARFGIPEPADADNLPAMIRGERRLWELWTLTGTRQWRSAVEFYESVATWGNPGLAMQARLAGARAYAECGQLEPAVRSLTLLALSPQTMGALAGEYRDVRALVATAPEFELLRHAELQMAEGWALLGWRRPGCVTVGLLAILGAVCGADYFAQTPLYVRFGNLPFTAASGEWYRPVTALFLHAGWEHWLMNAAALGIFGSAIERTWGGWRMLACFLVAGSAANCVSAALGSFDVSVGASGGVFGLVGAFGVAVYRLRAPAQRGLRRQMLWLLGLMLVTDLVIGGLETQIDNLAHAGGLVFGVGLALWVRPTARRYGTGLLL
jgi:rhomboid protease GluP